MICFAHRLPALEVAHQTVIGYDSAWIDEALRRAAASCNRDDFPFIAEIRDGILHYLEHRCSLRVLPLPDLFERMRRMLRRIGCHAIADHLTPLAPPLTVSLVPFAQAAGNGFELTFFQLLAQELTLLEACGAEVIRFCDLAPCLSILRGGKNHSKAARELRAEIEAFLRDQTIPTDSSVRKIKLTLEP